MNYFNRIIDYIIYVFIVLASLAFFKLSMLGRFSKLFELIGIALTVGMLLIHITYNEKRIFARMHFRIIVLFFLGSAFISMLAASAFHGQKISITLWEQRAIYFYLLYFLLHFFRLKVADLEKIFLAIALIVALAHFVQYFLYPTTIFDVSIMKDRGTIRVFLPGQMYLIISFFYLMQKVLDKFKVNYLLLMLLIFSVFIIRGGRSILFLVAFGVILMILLSKKVESKLVIFLLIVLSTIPIYFAFENVFLGLLQATEETRQTGTENVRLRATKYFLFEFFPNTISYLTGNGAPNSRSPYGRAMDNLMLYQGYFTSDIGIIGNYVKYGILFVFSVLASYFVSLKKIKGNKLLYIKIFLTISLVGLVMGGGFEKPDFIVFITTLFYIIDVTLDEYKTDFTET